MLIGKVSYIFFFVVLVEFYVQMLCFLIDFIFLIDKVLCVIFDLLLYIFLLYMCLQINLLFRVNFIEILKFKMESELFGLFSLLVGVLFGLLMEISNRR